MSTAPATTAGAAAAPKDAAAAPAATSKIETVPKEIRNRVLSGRTAAPPTIGADGKPTGSAAAPAAAAGAAAAPAATTEGAPAAAAPGAPAAGAAPPEPKPRVKKVKDGPVLPTKPADTGADNRTVEQIVRDVLPEITRGAAAPGAPASPALDPEVQREIDLAAFAEKKHGDRYAGMAAKVKTFFASHDELIAAKAKELGGQKSGEFKDWMESDDYKQWIAANRPSYQRGDKAKLAEDLIADRAREEMRQEMAPELKALERKTAELEHSPMIKAKANQALSIIITDPNEQKDPALEGFAKDPIKFGEAHPEEARLIAGAAAEAVEMIEEVYRIDLDLVAFNPRAPTPKQAKIREFSIGLNSKLQEMHPNGLEMQDGKILIDATTFNRLALHKDARYRTFTADEIAGSLAAARNAEVLSKLRDRREGVAKSIYAAPAAAPAAVPDGQTTGRSEGGSSPTAPSAAAPGGKGRPAADPWKETRRKALSGR